MESDPFITSQLTARDSLEGLVWCKFGHAPRGFPWGKNPRTPPSGWALKEISIKNIIQVLVEVLQKPGRSTTVLYYAGELHVILCSASFFHFH